MPPVEARELQVFVSWDARRNGWVITPLRDDHAAGSSADVRLEVNAATDVPPEGAEGRCLLLDGRMLDSDLDREDSGETARSSLMSAKAKSQRLKDIDNTIGLLETYVDDLRVKQQNDLQPTEASFVAELQEAKLNIEAETARANREALAAHKERARVEQCQAELERQQAQHATERRMLGEEMAQSFLENSATRMNLDKRDKEIRENRMRLDLATDQLKQARAKFEAVVREGCAINGDVGKKHKELEAERQKLALDRATLEEEKRRHSAVFQAAVAETDPALVEASGTQHAVREAEIKAIQAERDKARAELEILRTELTAGSDRRRDEQARLAEDREKIEEERAALAAQEARLASQRRMLEEEHASFQRAHEVRLSEERRRNEHELGEEKKRQEAQLRECRACFGAELTTTKRSLKDKEQLHRNCEAQETQLKLRLETFEKDLATKRDDHEASLQTEADEQKEEFQRRRTAFEAELLQLKTTQEVKMQTEIRLFEADVDRRSEYLEAELKEDRQAGEKEMQTQVAKRRETLEASLADELQCGRADALAKMQAEAEAAAKEEGNRRWEALEAEMHAEVKKRRAALEAEADADVAQRRRSIEAELAAVCAARQEQERDSAAARQAIEAERARVSVHKAELASSREVQETDLAAREAGLASVRQAKEAELEAARGKCEKDLVQTREAHEAEASRRSADLASELQERRVSAEARLEAERRACMEEIEKMGAENEVDIARRRTAFEEQFANERAELAARQEQLRKELAELADQKKLQQRGEKSVPEDKSKDRAKLKDEMATQFFKSAAANFPESPANILTAGLSERDLVLAKDAKHSGVTAEGIFREGMDGLKKAPCLTRRKRAVDCPLSSSALAPDQQAAAEDKAAASDKASASEQATMAVNGAVQGLLALHGRHNAGDVMELAFAMNSVAKTAQDQGRAGLAFAFSCAAVCCIGKSSSLKKAKREYGEFIEKQQHLGKKYESASAEKAERGEKSALALVKAISPLLARCLETWDTFDKHFKWQRQSCEFFRDSSPAYRDVRVFMLPSLGDREGQAGGDKAHHHGTADFQEIAAMLRYLETRGQMSVMPTVPNKRRKSAP